MPHHEHIKIEGRITDVFFHRFVVELSTGRKILADISPKGAEAFSLEIGAEIVAEGEPKPSELKVTRIAMKGKPAVTIEHKKKHELHEHPHHEHAEPNVAKKAVERAGFKPIGQPRRKPKHFEVLGRKGAHLVECHVEFDGHIRKEKAIETSDPKWASELEDAA